MLNFFRKNTKTIIWAVIIAFLLWGGFSVGTQFKEDGRYAGQVFGKNVSFQEFDRFYRSTQIFNFSEENAKDPEMLRESAWQGVIFSREAKRLKIEVLDNEVRDHILKILDQQKMSPDNYETWVERGLRLSPQQFEEMLRETLRIRKLLSKFEPSETLLQISPEEAKKTFLEENDKIAAEFIRFPNKKEADLFREKLKSPDDWKKEKDKAPAAFNATGGLVRVSMLSSFFQLSTADNVSLQLLEKGHFSGVLATGKDFSVFYVTDRAKGDMKDFDAKKTEHINSLKERKRQSLMVNPIQEILSRARLTDHYKRTVETL